MIRLANDEIELQLDPQRGAAIVHVSALGGLNVLAGRTWELPRPTAEVGSYGTSSADLHADYDLSWREQFPNAGPECVYAGTPLPFHGDAWSGAWTVVAQEPTSVELEFSGRLPLRLRRSMRLVGSSVLLDEVVDNHSPVALDFSWGHHPVVPATPGVRIDLPGGRVRAEQPPDHELGDLQVGAFTQWPYGLGADGPVDLATVRGEPVERMLVVDGIPGGWVAARDVARGVGLALAWDVATLPYLWLWLEVGGRLFPWFGRAAVLGLEPQSDPLARGLTEAAAQGHALRIEPGGTRTCWLTATVLTAVDRAVTGVDRTGTCAWEVSPAEGAVAGVGWILGSQPS